MLTVLSFLGKVLLEVVKFWFVVVLYRLITFILASGWAFLKAAWNLAFKKI